MPSGKVLGRPFDSASALLSRSSTVVFCGHRLMTLSRAINDIKVVTIAAHLNAALWW